MRVRITIRMTVAAVATALLMCPGAVRAGVEEEIAELRKELAQVREEVAEIKSILQIALKPQIPQKITAAVSVAGSPSLGRQNAPVTLVEFSDYQCPFCRRHFSTVYPILKKEYIDTGKIRYVFRDFPIAGLHPQAPKAHESARCAKEQNSYSELHDILFENSQDLSVPALKRYATKIARNDDQFNPCLESGKYAGEVEKEIAEGTQVGVSGTPSFFIGPSGSGEKITGTLVSGAQPVTRFKQVIEDLLIVASQGDEAKPEKEVNKKPSPRSAPSKFEVNPSQYVRVTTDNRSYPSSKPIIVTIHNELATVIYVPSGQPYCAVVSVQRREADRWNTEDSCVDGSPTFFIPMAPNSKMIRALGPASRDVVIQGPFVGQSSTPIEMEKNIRTLPRAKSWKPGDPIREVPLREIPAAIESLRFSALDHELAPGTYRIAVSFTLGASSDPMQTVYSEEFVVTN